MGPNLNLIEHLWRDPKTAVGRRHTSNVRDLEQFAKEERSKISVQRYKLVDGYTVGSNKTQLYFPKGVQPHFKLRVAIILSGSCFEFCVKLFSAVLVLF